jgi:TRAP-type C4-dicarboxylate transport system permease large subunit
VTVGFCVIVGVLSRWLYPLVARGMDAEGRPRTYAASLLVEGFRIRDLPEITMRSAQITGILAPLIGISVVMQQILSLLGAQAAIGEWVAGLGGYWVILAASMAIIFVAGMVLESLPVTIILAPILAPLAVQNGMDPIHFAVIFLVGASIGFVTPPYGLNLYVASSVTGVPYMRLLRYALYYLGALLAVWLLVAVTPVLTTMLLPAR